MFDEALAKRVRGVLATKRGVDERKMFGGLCFLVDSKMACGVAGDDLMVRVGPERYEEALARPGARQMDFTGRPLKGMVYVGRQGCATDAALSAWIEQGVEFARSQPAPKKRSPARSIAKPPRAPAGRRGAGTRR